MFRALRGAEGWGVFRVWAARVRVPHSILHRIKRIPVSYTAKLHLTENADHFYLNALIHEEFIFSLGVLFRRRQQNIRPVE